MFASVPHAHSDSLSLLSESLRRITLDVHHLLKLSADLSWKYKPENCAAQNEWVDLCWVRNGERDKKKLHLLEEDHEIFRHWTNIYFSQLHSYSFSLSNYLAKLIQTVLFWLLGCFGQCTWQMEDWSPGRKTCQLYLLFLYLMWWL